MENLPKAWHRATKRGIVIGVWLSAGFMIETLFLEDWPWWAWGIMALLGIVAWLIVDWLERRAQKRWVHQQAPPEQEAVDTPSPNYFTETESLAFLERELPVYWPVPVVRWVNVKATQERAKRLLAELEQQTEVDRERGYRQMAIFTLVAAERHLEGGTNDP